MSVSLSHKLSVRMRSAQASHQGQRQEDTASEVLTPDPVHAQDEGDEKRKEVDSQESESESDTEAENSGDVAQDDEGELVSFENPVGKKFMMYVEDEVRDEIRQIQEASKKGKPPRASQLKVFNTNTLRFLLRYNDRPCYQLTKNELAAMIADFIGNGCPPRCPKCSVGYLKFSNGKKRYGKRYYWCPGSTKNGRSFYGCNFRAPRDKVERIPWKCP